VQILFAFLLTIPFSQRFGQLSSSQRDIYVVGLLLTSLATALLIAPTSMHRLLFRRHDKAYLLRESNKLAMVGLATLMLAMVTVLSLIVDVVLGRAAGYLAAVGGLVAFSLLWFVRPLLRRLRPPGGPH
jgi:drug/metabolite transporter superfamily protein YnfA